MTATNTGTASHGSAASTDTDCRKCRSLLSFRDLKECGRSCRKGGASSTAYYCGLPVTEVVSVATIRSHRYLAHTDSWLLRLDDDTEDMEAYLESRVAKEGGLTAPEPGNRVRVSGELRWTRAGFRLALRSIAYLSDLSEEVPLRRLQVAAYRHCLIDVKERWARYAARTVLAEVLAYANRRYCQVNEEHVQLAVLTALVDRRPGQPGRFDT